jgi:hypothetical protein
MSGEHAATRASKAPRLRSDLLAAVLALVATATLLILAFIDPALAKRLTSEDQAVEWIQAALCVGAALAMAVRGGRAMAAHRPAAVELLAAALLIMVVIGELDLDKRLFGVKIIATRFFVDGRYGLAWRVLAVLVVVGIPVALAAYAFAHRAELWREGWRLLGTPRGRALVGGLAVFGATEMLEGALGIVPGLPRFVLEETLELVAGIGFFVGALARH